MARKVSWVGGTHSSSSVDTFYGFGEEQHHKATFTYDADHPLAFAAQDNGITPVLWARQRARRHWPSSSPVSVRRSR
jgi:hypothetical protein